MCLLAPRPSILCQPGRSNASRSLVLLRARGNAVGLVVGIGFIWRAVPRQDVHSGILQRHRNLHRLPRSRIDFGVVNRLRPLERVVVQSPERFRNARLVADRPAGIVQPYAVFREGPDGLDFERVIVDPSADGIAEETLLSLIATHLHAAIDLRR